MTQFNDAILILANVNNPQGWSAQDVAPNSFYELINHLQSGKPMVVWNGASDKSVFGNTDVNHAFRAWHDAIHYKFCLSFTPEGERDTMNIQISQMIEMFPEAKEKGWTKIIEAEISGQLEYQQLNGDFPVDQMAFVKAYLNDKKTALSTLY